MEELVLTKTQDVVEFDVELKGSNLDGILSNNLSMDGFAFKPHEFCGALKASELRLIADKLDELNKTL